MSHFRQTTSGAMNTGYPSASSSNAQPQRKQRAVLTCEECRRKKIRCTRGRSGRCERCKQQGISCRPSTSSSVSTPKIMLPADLDFSVLRLFDVVKDLQGRLGMSDIDLADLIKHHCAPPPAHELRVLEEHLALTSSLSAASRPGSAHSYSTLSSIDDMRTPSTPLSHESLQQSFSLSAAESRHHSPHDSPLFNARDLPSIPTTVAEILSSPSPIGNFAVSAQSGPPSFKHEVQPAQPQFSDAAVFMMSGVTSDTAPHTPPTSYASRQPGWSGIVSTASWVMDQPNSMTPQSVYIPDLTSGTWSA